MDETKRYYFYIGLSENLDKHRSAIFQLLSKYAKVTKLYLSETENKVYFATLEETEMVYSIVSKNLPFGGLIRTVAWPGRFTKSSPRGRLQSDQNEEVNLNVSSDADVNSEEMNSNNSSDYILKNYVDVLGNPIPVLEGEDCELYVSVKEAQKRGLKILTKEDYQSKIVTRNELIQYFEMYMQGKAHEFLQMYQCEDIIDKSVSEQVINRAKPVIFKRNDGASSEENTPPQKPLNNTTKRITSLTSPVSNATNSNRMKLNLNEIVKVNVTFIKNESIVFVNLADDTVEKFLIEVNLRAEKSPPVTQNNLREGTIYASLYEDVWCRVLLLQKDKLFCDYVDFGNHANCKLSEMRELPKELASRPYQAINIKVADPSRNLAENKIYFMKPIKETPFGYVGIFRENEKDFENVKPIPKKKLQLKSATSSASSGTESSDEVTRLPPLRSLNKRTHLEISPPRENTVTQKPSEIIPVTQRNISKPIRKSIAQFNNCGKSPTEKQEGKTQKNLSHIKESLFKNAAKEDAVNTSSVTWGERSTARIKPEEKVVNANKRSCVIDKVGTTGIIVPRTFIDECSFLGYIVSNDFDDEQEPLFQLHIDTGKVESLSDANIGDTVVVQQNEDGDDYWTRAVITEIRETGLRYTCALIDYGEIVIENDIYACPDDVIDICEFSFICTAPDKATAKKIRDFKESIFYAIKKPGECIITINGINYALQVKRWNPFIKDTTKKATPVKIEKVYKCIPPSYTLTNKDILRIVKEKDGFLYVKTKECHNVLQEINKEILKIKNESQIINELQVNQMVLAGKSDDENLHRALITKITGNEATVNFIDYGEIETVPLKTLRNVNENLSKKYCGIVIAPKLVHYDKKQFTSKSLEYIQECINRKKKFNVRLCENDTVDLISTDDGSSLVKKLTELDQPLITYDKAQFYCPTQGHTKLMCLNTEDLKRGLLVFCFANNYAQNILNLLENEIGKYIEKKTDPYEPSLKEICLAQFQGDWYRAVVTGKNSDGYMVSYLDYGNSSSVLPSQIRKIPPELIAHPCVALHCLLSLGGLKLTPKGIPEPQFKQLNELLKEAELYEVNIKPATDPSSFLIKYIVEIPSVSKQLEYEYDGLL